MQETCALCKMLHSWPVARGDNTQSGEGASENAELQRHDDMGAGIMTNNPGFVLAEQIWGAKTTNPGAPMR
jgi:hypothetical protein